MAAFSSSAFSTSAFSELAFDFGGSPPAPSPSPDPELLGGKDYSYTTPYSRYREEEYKRRTAEEKRAVIEEIDDKIAEAESRRLAAIKRSKARLLAENAAIKLAALEVTLQEEINRLRIERAWLMRLIDDEEAMLVLLMSLPFH